MASSKSVRPGAKSGCCCKQRDAGAGVQADLAGVGLVEAGEDAQQRRLADAVGADQADALAGVQLEAEVLEQRVGVEAAAEVRATEQATCAYCEEMAKNGEERFVVRARLHVGQDSAPDRTGAESCPTRI